MHKACRYIETGRRSPFKRNCVFDRFILISNILNFYTDVSAFYTVRRPLIFDAIFMQFISYYYISYYCKKVTII